MYFTIYLNDFDVFLWSWQMQQPLFLSLWHKLSWLYFRHYWLHLTQKNGKHILTHSLYKSNSIKHIRNAHKFRAQRIIWNSWTEQQKIDILQLKLFLSRYFQSNKLTSVLFGRFGAFCFNLRLKLIISGKEIHISYVF